MIKNMEFLKDYIGELIGAAAVIIAALIGLLARKGNRNKQIAKNNKNSKIYQANGSMNVGKEEK